MIDETHVPWLHAWASAGMAGRAGGKRKDAVTFT